METSSSLNYVVAFIQPFQLDAVVDALRQLPQFPGMNPGDGKIFAGPATLAYRIRTAEWGESAILGKRP